MSELVKLDPKDFGIEETTAQNIEAQFKPMLEKMTTLELEYNNIIVLPIEDPNTAKIAKELLQKYVKVRTGTAAIHKEQKNFYLAGGRYVDGWKNAQLFAANGKEEKLQQIVNFAGNQEKERKDKLQQSRAALLSPFVQDVSHLDLGGMNEEVWNAYLAAKKQDHADRLAAELQVELDRKERIRQEEEAREEQRKENERLKKEADEREAAHKKEMELQAEKAKKEREEEAQKQAAEMAKKEAEMAEERRLAKIESDKREKAEAEAKALRDAEELRLKKEREEKAAETKRLKELAKAPDNEKLLSWLNSFTVPENSPKVSEESNAIIQEIESKYTSFLWWAKDKINNL